jgi:RNA-binding protein
MSDPLTSRQRAHLRKLAHHLDPVVHVGQRGLTEAVIAGVEETLAAHELIKVRLAGDRERRSELTAEIARRTGANLAGTIGRIAILYREHADPERRSIELPD